MTDSLSFSFPKSLRLLDSKSYSTVFNNAQKIGGRFLLFLYRENAIKTPRVGIVVAKKHVKRAVGRNRIKRLIRESFRLHQHELIDCDIVVLAMKGVDDLSNREIFDELERKWRRLSRSS